MTVRGWSVLAIIMLASVAVLGTAMSSVGAQDKGKGRSRITWEYKVVKGELDETKLSELGNQGWELVHLTGGQPYVSTSTARAFAGATTTTNTVNEMRKPG